MHPKLSSAPSAFLHALGPVLGLALGFASVIPLEASAAERAASAPRRVGRKIANLPSKVSTQVQTREIPVYEDQSGTGLALFLGAGGGMLTTTPADPSLPSSGGSLLQGRAGLSFHNSRLVLDLGLGWIYSKIDGTYTLSEGGRTSTTESAVLTRAGLVEFSPRYRLTRNLELGPVGSVLFGTNASFSEDIEGSSSPVFLGARAAAVFESKDFLFRISAQASTAITLPDRQAFLASATLEIGIPLVRGKTVIREKEIHTVRDNYSRETFEVEIPVVTELVAFNFDDQVVHFEFDRAQLTLESEVFLSELGRYLAESRSNWKELTIDGHTDQRGTEEYNRRLSEDRVAAVKRVLVAAGVEESSVATRAFGKSKPIDRGVADISHARNRRVEMSFSEVSDARALRDAINRIRFATARPSTCSGDSCR